jgi:hypothetical protein
MSAEPAPMRSNGNRAVSRAALRRRPAKAADRIIAAPGVLDGDPDFEPSLGWTRAMAWGSTDDREPPGTENGIEVRGCCRHAGSPALAGGALACRMLPCPAAAICPAAGC